MHVPAFFAQNMGPANNNAVKRQREQMQNIPRMKSISSSSSLPMPIDYGDLANAAGADVVMRAAAARHNYHSGGRTDGRRDSRTRTNEWRCALGRKGGREGGAGAVGKFPPSARPSSPSLLRLCAIIIILLFSSLGGNFVIGSGDKKRSGRRRA